VTQSTQSDGVQLWHAICGIQCMISSRRRLLCIESDATTLLSRKLLLQSAGYSVLTASTVWEGLTLLRRCPVSAVIVSAQREIDGAHLKWLKQVQSDVPMILLSESIDRNDDRAMRMSADHVVESNDASALFDILHRMLNRAFVRSGGFHQQAA
jgi:DNA-binding response OmpR family regulator